jgi:hypothetical protein
MGYGLWAMGYGLWAMGYGLWAMGYGLWAMGYGLQWSYNGAIEYVGSDARWSLEPC